jgi:hypothetical protein
MAITLNLFYSGFFLFICNIVPPTIKKLQIENHDQVRQIAILDFSKTKLCKMDSVFYVSLYDTLHRMALKKTDEHHYKWAVGNSYPEIIAVNIDASRNKFVLDTTADISVQTVIPSRCIELNGKLFYWRDKHYPLTNNTIKILDKYHCLRRGGHSDTELDNFKLDDAMKAANYYFCRNNLSIYKRVISNKAIGYYDPPDITCK